MRLTVILMIVASLKVSAGSYAQSVSLSLRNAPLEEVFTAVKKQTGYLFFYDRDLLRSTRNVTISAQNQPLGTFLAEVFKEQPLDYSIKDKTIFIRPKPAAPASPSASVVLQEIKGSVTGEDGLALIGVSIKIKGTSTGTVTDVNGGFSINAEPGSVLVVSFIGYETREVTVPANGPLAIRLKAAVSSLDETVVIGYGSASRRSLTSSVSSVKSKDIENSPVVDPFAAMQGRLAGVFISSSNGLPGARFNVTLRGQNSLLQSNQPLYVVDGIPYFNEPLNDNTFNSANGELSPLASINPSDIERIDVLKDADATAIYGSRAGNGVILITTKKGKAGKARVNFNVFSGASKVVNKLPMLSNSEYLEMRKEAFANDGETPTEENAPDLLLWDQQKGRDWQKELIGGTANITEAQGSVSGGTEQTRFLLSGTYTRQTTVMPNNPAYTRGASHINIDHNSADKKFNISASVNYSSIKDRSIASDLTYYYDMVPNYPVYGDDGKLYWFNTMQNPYAYIPRRSNARTNNLIANSVIRYTVLPGLNAKVNLGYTNTNLDQVQVYPNIVFNPQSSPGSMTYFGNTDASSWLVEPQLEYTRTVAKGELQVLAGATWQQNLREGNRINATNFSSDALLENMQAAGNLVSTSIYSLYRYTSAFGRVTYNWDEKYVINGSFRRDGSTRFGPGNRFGNFGAIGAAWIFSNEPFIKGNNVLSFGKLRGSWGTVGSDNIGTNDYLDSWSPVGFIYDGIAGIAPSRLANNDYKWEESRKSEVALELGFLQDRILFNTNYYYNVTGNQLIDFALTPQVGFEALRANFDALVQNSGWEFELNTVNVRKKDFTWNSSFNLTINKNKLKKFDGIENSSYKDQYVVGESLTIQKGYEFLRVNPDDGVAEFRDLDGDGDISEFTDYVILGQYMPKYYGGLQNSLRYKNLELDFLFQFVNQEGPGINYGYESNPYGVLANKDRSALNRWRKKGDITNYPRATTTGADVGWDLYRLSTAVWGDASYIRLKNVSLRYDLTAYARALKLSRLVVYANAQNLLTFTDYEGLDPETQGFRMPPLKNITAGIQLTF
ncbi:SusC/RagA family TonB-linked outer membrane protein [Chitinophaga sp. GCM10012297]|uniref:SusC/RagA family TonB-linked outer membrane protein n=1 Tax=Chitinophaga chungangae TaxID=2821488 RepID=A0ABS3YC47_9BACT|nr:SusC/RagA family TonB-linked outer membrane protein [Chitinophaga chungangae]MBO9152249.1 SusC/RagA family TonB-linked outer membrane protein [Chitinophaga chungangae]